MSNREENPEKRANRSRTINDILSSDALLRQYLGFARQARNQTELILPFIPPELRDKVRMRSISGTTLAMEAKSAAVAMRIRQLSERLITEFKKEQRLKDIQKIECKVAIF